MVDSVTIKSSRNDYELTLSLPQPLGSRQPVEYLQVNLNGNQIAASSSKVYIYEASQLASFFSDLAVYWKGWEGEKQWQSVEGDFLLGCRSNSRGHVAVRVTLKSGPYEDDWSVTAIIHIDAGQLGEIASKVRDLLHVKDDS